ncbi:MAG TPA: hypothetical protein VFG23_19790 [Polyangia bacterium]|nr:hypothetical protein [Polyangia bacterium]
MSDPSTQSPADGDWQTALTLRYPLARSVGFACFGGWQNILARLLDRLEAASVAQPVDARGTFHILDIKQKFGRLTIRLSKEGTPEMQDAVREAEEASVVTCEVCSLPGRLAERNAWWSVRCAKHESWSRLDEADLGSEPARPHRPPSVSI